MRPWTKRAMIAALGLAIAWTAPALAQSLTPTATPAPAHTAAGPPVQVYQAPSQVGPTELHQLAATLASADGAPVVLRVPGSATIDASEGDLTRLAEAAVGARFFVVQQGDARLDGAAAILSAFADVGFRQPGADEASGKHGELWPVVGRLTHCQDPCPPSRMTSDAPSWLDLDSESPVIEADLAASDRLLAEALDAPAPDGGGLGATPLVLGLLILIAGGITAVARGRSRPPAGVDAGQDPRPDPGPDPGPDPDPDPGPPAPRPPAPTGRGHRARVVSVLDPEGYVELDRCLRRARWASSGTPPATPGEWVDIERRGRRLWAYAAARPTAPAHKPERMETQP